MMYDKAQCKILFQIIRVSLFDSDEFEINAEADWKLIYRISREHKIHTILCRGLEKISSKDKIPEKMIGKLEELWQIERAKDAVQKYSIDEILDAFEKDKIDCVPLKGIYMKEFYPDSSLRTMSDLDIFYRQGDEEKIEKVLVSKGYVFDHDGPHHDVYQRKPFMNVEMHGFFCICRQGVQKPCTQVLPLCPVCGLKRRCSYYIINTGICKILSADFQKTAGRAKTYRRQHR